MPFAFDSDTFRLYTDGNKEVVRRLSEQLDKGEAVSLSAVAAEETV